MTNQSKIISIKAKKGFFSPKKSNDQSALSNNWMPKIRRAFFVLVLFFWYLLQIIPKAIPIMIYKIVQTGAKTQAGGLKNGFSMVGNQT